MSSRLLSGRRISEGGQQFWRMHRSEGEGRRGGADAARAESAGRPYQVLYERVGCSVFVRVAGEVGHLLEQGAGLVAEGQRGFG